VNRAERRAWSCQARTTKALQPRGSLHQNRYKLVRQHRITSRARRGGNRGHQRYAAPAITQFAVVQFAVPLRIVKEGRARRDVRTEHRAVQWRRPLRQGRSCQQSPEMIAVRRVELRPARIMNFMAILNRQCDRIAPQSMRYGPATGGDGCRRRPRRRRKNPAMVREPGSRLPKPRHVRRHPFGHEVRPVPIADHDDDDRV
jgi:hypothetical protein